MKPTDFKLGEEYTKEQIESAKDNNSIINEFGNGLNGENFIVLKTNILDRAVSFMKTCSTGIGPFYTCIYSDCQKPSFLHKKR